uniref:Mos1 transposase HTH domain-containing protein n=1 Tax=Acrobeloides nanus TaxID=290746 RepID=A0A914EEY4_9BILA
MVFLKAFLVLSFSLFSIAIERDVIHYRYIALYEFDRQFEGQINSHVAYENITSVYGENSVSYSTVRRWFEHFKAGNFELEDKPIPGRAVTEYIESKQDSFWYDAIHQLPERWSWVIENDGGYYED